ncbi:MAG: efflux RND transporter periplasmic adaptor subunit [Legionellales bacterium]|nr:efflux RND transporter periplasmic adaptor subunit [Legionellales bacterium]
MLQKSKFILIVIVVLLLILVFHYWHKKNNAQDVQKGSVVSTMTVKNQSWQASLKALGNVKASQSVQLSTEIGGIVSQVNFVSGQAVKAGEVLVKLRADDIEAAVEKDTVIVAADEKNYQRLKSLYASKALAFQDMDNSLEKLQEAKAELKQQQAILAHHTITAPFSGIVGIRRVDNGQYLAPGQVIVNIESYDPAYVDFAIPERLINQINIGGIIKITSPNRPQDQLTGEIIATSHAVDINNRSLLVRGRVANPQEQLLTGMSVEVLVQGDAQQRIVIPQTALCYTPDGVGVYVVGKNQHVHWRAVTLGEREEDSVVIHSGLKNGDVIVTVGQNKLAENTLITSNNADPLN